MSVLNAHNNQGALDLFVTLLDFYKLVVDKLFFCLGEIVFETDMVGANAYYLLRHLIQDYKVNINQGIKEKSDRIKQLQTYLPFVPSKSLDKRQASKEEFTKIEVQEILDNTLPKNYHKELTLKQWDIYKQPFRKTVDKLEAAKPVINQATATAKKYCQFKHEKQWRQ